MENEALGDRIRRLRESRRWTQPELAEMLDVSTRTVSNWESGRNHPRSRMGALQELFGPLLEPPPSDDEPRDEVEAALAKSGLDDWRQDEVRSVYRRNVREQKREVRPA